MKQVIETPFVLISAAILIWFTFLFIRKYKIWKEDGNEALAIIGGVVCGVIGGILTIVGIISLYLSILAITCPEMFTINQIISATVSK
jgi:hypothetical protein